MSLIKINNNNDFQATIFLVTFLYKRDIKYGYIYFSC